MTIETPFGPVSADFNAEGALTALKFGAPASNGNGAGNPAVVRQLGEYFARERKTFELPLAPEGTEFQKRVWTELARIPYGETVSYAELARRVGREGAARAVGRANGTNPIAIIVPCHRVIGADGSLTGYAYGVELKRRLLDLEHPWFLWGGSPDPRPTPTSAFTRGLDAGVGIRCGHQVRAPDRIPGASATRLGAFS